jgi:hypothetical protein
MNNYNELKEQWGRRSQSILPANGATEIIKKGKTIRRKQLIGLVVLGSTCVILIGFFFYISAYTNKTVSIGLLLMIGSLTFRILIESFFTFSINNFRPDESLHTYSEKLKRYYKSRLVINYLITPILFISYIVGFIMLLPAFKQNLSAGFYQYVFYSSWVIFFFLAVLIAVQIRKELSLLRELKKDIE